MTCVQLLFFKLEREERTVQAKHAKRTGEAQSEKFWGKEEERAKALTTFKVFEKLRRFLAYQDEGIYRALGALRKYRWWFTIIILW